MNTIVPNTVRSSGCESALSTLNSQPLTDFFSATDIARAVFGQVNSAAKKKVLRTARRERWPEKFDGYKVLFQPPSEVAEIVVARPATLNANDLSTPLVRFADLAHSDDARQTVIQREEAVKLFHSQKHLGCEVAYETCAAIMRARYAGFKCSARVLRVWVKDYASLGIDGLVEQKRGRVGRKAFVNDLQQSEILQMAADAVDHGNWKRNNVRRRINKAEAFRNAVANPTITGPARTWLHGDRASKSAMPPSVSKAIDALVSPLAATRIQVGAKAAKLDGAYTNCSYDNVRAGDAFTADDMTANCYVWTEWPNEQGFILQRPQILASADIGSMSWLNLRAVMRPKGQYTKDDVWGLIGDIFDDYGLFKIAVLEGGIWQSNVIAGQKIQQKNSFANEETRVLGLKSLGVKLIHTRTPRGKIIETMFNSLQHAADNVRGFCGRDERKDCPEETKKNLAQVRAGHAHPRQYFLHIAEYSAHLKGVMNALNNTRGDGKILRGLCPAEKWAEDTAGVEREIFPDKSKWMYRAAYRVEKVTKNGVRITVGTGKYQNAYSYYAPELENQRGRRVIIFWNDYDPDTDAVVYTIQSGQPDKLICVAPRVPDAPRFGTTEEQMAAASTHKKLQAQLVRTQSETLAPYFQRNFKTVAAQRKTAEVNEQLHAVRVEQGKRIRSRKAVADFRGDARELLGSACETPASEFSPAEATSNTDNANPRAPLSDADGSCLEVEANSRSESPVEILQPKNSLEEKNGKFIYHLKSSGGDKAKYVDYLIGRLTEFRKAGASFGQTYHANVTFGITKKIAQSQLKCDLHDESHFDEICASLKSKIDATILGKRNAAKGVPNYHEFESHCETDLSAAALLD